jgi:hypothetical protein
MPSVRGDRADPQGCSSRPGACCRRASVGTATGRAIKPAVRKSAPPPPVSTSPQAWDGPDLDSLGELETTGTIMHDDPPPVATPPVSHRSAPPAAPKQKACPSCGGVISAFARICEHCGANVATGGAAPMNSATPKKYAAQNSDDDNMGVLNWLLILFCGVIGLVVAIIYTVQGKGKGPKMLMVAGILFVIGFVLGLIRAFAEM